MASTPDVNRWAETTLWAVGCMLEDIHDRAPDWDERPEDERADFFLEWEGLLNRLEGVVDDDRAGSLTDEQHQELRQLAQRLATSRDVIMRIGLDFPDLSRLSLAS
jgi:hypothetical protein